MVDRITVREFMTTDIISLEPDLDVLRAIGVFLRHDISGAPVVDPSGELVGMLTERDCMKVALDAAFHQQSGGTVRDFMATEVVTIPAEESIVATARRFYEDTFLRFPVVDGSGMIGIISRRDVMRAMGEYWKVEWNEYTI